MNFRFDDSSTQNEQNLLLQPPSLCRELGKGCAHFPGMFMAGIAIIYALTVSGECYQCYSLILLTAAFCQLPVTVYRFVTTIFFYVSFPLKDRDFEASETYIFQNMWSTSFDVLFHCICLGCYLVFSCLSHVEFLNAQRSSIIQNLKR